MRMSEQSEHTRYLSRLREVFLDRSPKKEILCSEELQPLSMVSCVT